MDVLNWLLPSGWVVAMIELFITIRQRRAKVDEESNQSLMRMAATLKTELITNNAEILKLYDAITELAKVISKAGACPHSDNCPILAELPKSQASDIFETILVHRSNNAPAGDNQIPDH